MRIEIMSPRPIVGYSHGITCLDGDSAMASISRLTRSGEQQFFPSSPHSSGFGHGPTQRSRHALYRFRGLGLPGQI